MSASKSVTVSYICNFTDCESVTVAKLQSETSSARMGYEAYKISVDTQTFFSDSSQGGRCSRHGTLFQSETTTSRMNSEAFMGAGCWRNCKMWVNAGEPTNFAVSGSLNVKKKGSSMAKGSEYFYQGSFFFQQVVFGGSPLYRKHLAMDY